MKRIGAVFFILTVICGVCCAQKIFIVNNTSGDVALKVQNEETLLFDRLTLSPYAKISIESENSRRITAADSIHFYILNEIKDGCQQYSIYALSLPTTDADQTGFDEESTPEIDITIEDIQQPEETQQDTTDTAQPEETQQDTDTTPPPEEEPEDTTTSDQQPETLPDSTAPSSQT